MATEKVLENGLTYLIDYVIGKEKSVRREWRSVRYLPKESL
jgi:hypothetical protein